MSHGKVLCLVSVVVLILSCSAFAAKGPAGRSYVSGNFFLSLDGTKAGFVKSVDGGDIWAEVINEPKSPSYFTKKHIGQPQYEDITIQLGFSMTKVVYNWIRQSWSMGGSQRLDGSIVAFDYQLNPVSERQFQKALITETTIPAADAASKEPSYITLKFAPEVIRVVKPSGNKKDYGEYGKNEQKVWLPSNFKLEIDGLDCTKVSKIDSFTVKQIVATNTTGGGRDTARESTRLEFPNLKITLPESSAQTWLTWHEDFVVKGNNDESREKGGTLSFLSPSQKEPVVLASIKFFNMGIARIRYDKSEANADQIKRVQAELYVERMEFNYGKNVIASDPTETPDGAVALTPATTADRPS